MNDDEKRMRELKLEILSKMEAEIAKAKEYFSEDWHFGYTGDRFYAEGHEGTVAAELEKLVAQLRDPYIPEDDAEMIRLVSLYRDTPIHVRAHGIPYSPRLVNALVSNRIFTIGDLLRWDSEQEPRNRGPFRNVGDKTTKELVEAMRDLGFKRFGEKWYDVK